MTSAQKFGHHAWQESQVDTDQEHFVLTYVPDSNSTPIRSALIGRWNAQKQYFPFKLITDDPEAIAHAVDITNKAFNEMLTFDTKLEPLKAWDYFREKTQTSEYLIGNVRWQFIRAKDDIFTEEIDQFMNTTGEKTVDSNWCEVDTVDDSKEHFKLYYRVEDKINTTEYIPIAKVGDWDWMQEAFLVEFLNVQTALLEATKQDLDYYLNALPKQRNEVAETHFGQIWQYQRYHCSSASNLYNKVLWRLC